MTLQMFNHRFQWALFVIVSLLQTLTPVVQNVPNLSSAATTAPVIFNFVPTPDVGSIGSLAADTENDIWATPDNNCANAR